MTKQELIKMFGKEEQADYAINIILNQITEKFVVSSIKAEIKEAESRIAELESEEVVYFKNGEFHVNWKFGIDSDKQYEAEILIYKLNRLKSMIAIR